MDCTSEGQFKNQPRLGAAIRQRSHSTKELATMLQQLQMSVQLMPLSQPANQPNLASTSEEDSDSLNSNEVSTSEDEAFGDYEDDEDDYTFAGLKAFGKLDTRKSRPKPAQLNLSNSFSTGLVYPKKLRRSNSLGVLNSKQPYKDSYRDLYCEDDYEDTDFRESFRVFSNEFRRSSALNSRNSSFRSTLPRVRLRYSTSLKDNLNSLVNSGYCSDNYNSQRYAGKFGDELDDKFTDKFTGKFAGKFTDKYRDTYAEKYGDYKSDRLFSLSDYFKNEPSKLVKLKRSENVGLSDLSSENNTKSKQNPANVKADTGKALSSSSFSLTSTTSTVRATTSSSATSSIGAAANAIDDNRNLVNGNQSSTSTDRPSSGEEAGGQSAAVEWITRRGDCLNQQSATDPPSNSVCLSSFNQLNHPKQSDHSVWRSIAAAAGDDNCAATSGLVGSAVSGGAYEITAQCESKAADINNKVNFKSLVSSRICEPSVEYSSSNDLKIFEKSKIHSEQNQSRHSHQQQKTNETHAANSSHSSGAQRPSSDKCVIQTTTTRLQPQESAESNDHHRLSELELATAGVHQPLDQRPQPTGLNCDENVCDTQSGDVLVTNGSSARQPVIKSILKRPASRSSSASRASLAFRSPPDLPVLIEEQQHRTSSTGDRRRAAVRSSPEMQTLAETQYNQLGYHIAALSCVCDNKQNLTSNFSPFNSSSTNNPNNYNNQNSPSSVDSDEYSSPYNSPPSSPSSVSSYSSAEEDCSILTSCVQNGLKLSHSSASSLDKALSGSNQSLADLITVDHSKLVEPSLDVVDCASMFASSPISHHSGLLTTATSLAKFNSDLNNNKDGRSKAVSLSNGTISDVSFRLDHSGEQQSETDDQLTSEKQPKSDHNGNSSDGQQSSADHPTSDPPAQQAQNKPQARVRKTSILRNQTPPDLSNYCKKEVKFADTLGFALEKVKYFPPASPQVKPKRHSVNLASLHRDYDEQHELFILHSRPQTEDIQTLAKRFEERSALFSKQQTRLNLETNIFSSSKASQSRAGGSYYSPPSQWGGHLFRDEYCGDMFHPFEGSHPSVNTQSNHENSNNDKENGPAPAASNSLIKAANLMSSGFSSMSYKSSSSLEFNGFTFMNNHPTSGSFSSIPSLSSFPNNATVFLPLNFCAQPHIQSDFPNRLHSQSVLLHSLEFVGNTINGIISVMNLTFEKKIVVKHTLNKWVTEKQCEARYSKKDCDNSDKFVFQISLKETDFPQFQLDEDRTMMFAVRYETGDGRIYWDNNFGQDYRLKCKFN